MVHVTTLTVLFLIKQTWSGSGQLLNLDRSDSPDTRDRDDTDPGEGRDLLRELGELRCRPTVGTLCCRPTLPAETRRLEEEEEVGR